MMSNNDYAGINNMIDDLMIGDQFFELYDRMVGDGVDLESVLQHVANVAKDVTHAERATVYLVNEETRELESVGLVGNVINRIVIPIDNRSLAGYCAMAGRAYVVNDVYGDLSSIDPELRFDGKWDKINNFVTKDVMCAPACFKNDIVGVVQVINSLDGQFGERDLVPLNTLSRLTGYALYHARIYADLASLKQVDREKSNFIRLLVHELKSPVAAARSLISLMEGGYATSPDQVTKYSARAGDRLDQLTSLIKDILEMSMVKSRDSIGEVRELELATVIHDHMQSHIEAAERKNLMMEIDLSADPLTVRFDSKGLEMVLSNLLSNAVKYTLEGTVGVRLYRKDDQAVLEVSDSGIGIPGKDLPNMFKEFHRASNARKQDYGLVY